MKEPMEEYFKKIDSFGRVFWSRKIGNQLPVPEWIKEMKHPGIQGYFRCIPVIFDEEGNTNE